jgi:ABC-type sulfate/molybdate transport systems ATPase subunit
MAARNDPLDAQVLLLTEDFQQFSGKVRRDLREEICRHDGYLTH